MTTMTIDSTTLCPCRHILNSHPDGEACTTTGCRCTRFTPASRRSSSHYQRGQRTTSKRVARLEPGDVILVGFPGYHEYVRGADGELVWEQRPGELTSRPAVRQVQDNVLRLAQRKTGALLATVTGHDRDRPTGPYSVPMHRIHTSLGDLPGMPGAYGVMVLK
jgi:hypothetical protein